MARRRRTVPPLLSCSCRYFCSYELLLALFSLPDHRNFIVSSDLVVGDPSSVKLSCWICCLARSSSSFHRLKLSPARSCPRIPANHPPLSELPIAALPLACPDLVVGDFVYVWRFRLQYLFFSFGFILRRYMEFATPTSLHWRLFAELLFQLVVSSDSACGEDSPTSLCLSVAFATRFAPLLGVVCHCFVSFYYFPDHHNTLLLSSFPVVGDFVKTFTKPNPLCRPKYQPCFSRSDAVGSIGGVELCSGEHLPIEHPSAVRCLRTKAAVAGLLSGLRFSLRLQPLGPALFVASPVNRRLIYSAFKNPCRVKDKTLINLGQILVSWFLGQSSKSLSVGLMSPVKVIATLGQFLFIWWLGQCSSFLVLGLFKPRRTSILSLVLSTIETLYLQNWEVHRCNLKMQFLGVEDIFGSTSSNVESNMVLSYFLLKRLLSLRTSLKKKLFCSKSSTMERITLSLFFMENDAKNLALTALGVQGFVPLPLATKPMFFTGYWTARVFSRPTCDHPFQGSGVSTLQAQVWIFKIQRILSYFVWYYIFERPTINHWLALHHFEWHIFAASSATLRVFRSFLLEYCIRVMFSCTIVRDACLSIKTRTRVFPFSHVSSTAFVWLSLEESLYRKT